MIGYKIEFEEKHPTHQFHYAFVGDEDEIYAYKESITEEIANIIFDMLKKSPVSSEEFQCSAVRIESCLDKLDKYFIWSRW